MLKLQKHLRPIGINQHRSGWPYVMQALEKYHNEAGIVFDDFVDRSFSYEPVKQPYDEPWIGVFHNPPKTPLWFDARQSPMTYFQTLLFQASYANLRLAITLSKYLGDWLNSVLGIPVVTLKHPTEIPDLQWSERAYLENRSKKLIQIGWWLRNLEAIYQLPLVTGFDKVRLRQPYAWVQQAEERCKEFWSGDPSRYRYGMVFECSPVSNENYDLLLSQNVVFMELFDTSANNAVIECIARNTPIVVNRHPALEEYLGEEYPLFYEDFNDAFKLLQDDLIIAGHRYLQTLDKTKYDVRYFTTRLMTEVRRYR